MTRALPAALTLTFALACGGPRTGAAVPAAARGPAATYADVSAVFAMSCATQGCHTGHPPANTPDSFDPQYAYDALVGQPALQVPSLPLVDPGNPDHSYVVLKVRGTASGVGGVATRMPLNAHPLSDEDQAALESWILAGASHD
ncbi:hypothetical protein [Anaeromyxobacter diazotrophicus]|uniref:Cytochrome c domain-containing protein n=1 Tax=Anaeromyxobacter diazotrophicus TaxID=2590199 RepID=A0A7I9VJY6_9BACT|nr:hypothetical protein [Anaeromyxobacter diazotrophicus]GEJ56499.1 hypothetical protein AMYX_12400 [Anaeromyxobacter diazotrophicus]